VLRAPFRCNAPPKSESGGWPPTTEIRFGADQLLGEFVAVDEHGDTLLRMRIKPTNSPEEDVPGELSLHLQYAISFPFDSLYELRKLIRLVELHCRSSEGPSSRD
jgi:hypothetical protein